MAYNLPGIHSLNLTLDHLVKMYNGTYTHWNHTEIQSYNPGCILPYRRILVTARADDSGSTEMFTSALSDFSEYWANTYGNFSAGLDEETDLPVHWDPGVIALYGRTGRGMSGLILSYTGVATNHELTEKDYHPDGMYLLFPQVPLVTCPLQM